MTCLFLFFCYHYYVCTSCVFLMMIISWGWIDKGTSVTITQYQKGIFFIHDLEFLVDVRRDILMDRGVSRVTCK